MNSHIFQINASRGGVPKSAVREATLIATGLTIDVQRLTQFHGGTERALCLYSLEKILALQREGHPIYPGSTGENVTLAGIDWDELRIGTRLKLGDEVAVEISSYTVPCKQIAASFIDGNFKRISQVQHSGWSRLYVRVIEAGNLVIGQTARVL
ncbi:MAG: MOSC domain-containing protein [Pyrinomonadaceae bacterium MAG19_C2-C3]|nr:MOSC domain-containing protein [Pyrinomonadaceae bacterium MAG19_C2-C3]